MTDRLFYEIWADAQDISDIDAFSSDWTLSSAFLPADDPDAPIDEALWQQLRALWHVAHDPFKDLLRIMGLSQTGCSVRFCIPLRTVQDWAGEKHTSPPYIRLMMAEAVGLVDLRRHGQS